ncbi:MAG: hypothetical protein LBT71_00480 [Azoarcus sp.]|nr:hypothetical protein [Azoarcus sp.]
MNNFERKTRRLGRLPRVAALALVCAAGALAASLASASTGADADIPDVLMPWKAWVLHGQDAWLCPEVAGEHERDFCAWPGELTLEARADGARFTQTWEIQRESAAALPGNRAYWPQQVTAGEQALPVLERKGAPVVWLPPGRHTVSGVIPWAERPQALAVPENVALIALSIGGKPVLPLERSGNSLTLGRGEENAQTAAREEDSQEFQVYRKLSDGIPARLLTRVQFKVSGKARELSVPDILPEHFVPVRIVSSWMARIDADGRLQVQALPGQATVEIEARHDRALATVTPRLTPERPQEVWSYEAAPSLRSTSAVVDGDVGQALAVDPRQAGVPLDWVLLPAFALNEGARLKVEERSRGQNERENQRLTLQREMWLDFSGAGFFARDRIEGSMRQGWRFDVARPYTLERADSLIARPADANWGSRQLASNVLGGAQGLMAALLVTRLGDERLSGVEWRQPQVTLNASVRLAESALGRFPVTGWRQAFDSVDTTLHLPYGYRLIAATGVDKASRNVWVERWTILNVFLAALFTLLAWRLLGAVGGLAAAFYLTLAMPEPLSPAFSFAAVVVLALLRQAMPEGRLRKVFLGAERLALLCFVGLAVFFIPAQIRYALHPQLEEDATAEVLPIHMAATQARQEDLMADVAEMRQQKDAVDQQVMAPRQETMDLKSAAAQPLRAAPPAASPRMRAASPPPPASSLNRSMRENVDMTLQITGNAPAVRQRYAQSTVTQTGGGEPSWALGQQYGLHWSGPVAATQSVRLVISPPWLTRLLRVAMLALLGALAWSLFRKSFPAARPPSASAGSPPASSVAAALSGACLALLLAAGIGFPAPAAAESAFPPAELLEGLKARLTEPPDCAPSCVDVPEARIEAETTVFRVLFTAHAGAAGSLALPEADGHLTLRGARVDGEARPVLRFAGNNYVALARGVHHVQIEYAPSDDSASLSFPIPPARVEFAGTGWTVEGINENRLLNETLNFSRTSVADTSAQPGKTTGPPERAAQQFPPFVHVQRDIEIDLDWSVRTLVRRVAPAEGGFTFSVPLLPGEHVTTPEVKVQDNRALAVFTSSAEAASWQARLDKTPGLELAAPLLSERAETWRVTVGPSWHLEWNGVPMTLSRNESGQAVFEFHPLPGEKLTLAPVQPVMIEGRNRAIDRVALTGDIGQHAADYTLYFVLRASQGGEHRLTLPEDLEVLDVQREGASLNLQARGGQLSLPVSPGRQAYTLKLRQQGDIGWAVSSPAIDLDLPAANIDLRMALGGQRWVLAASGPAVGPAVLYWGELAVALILALLLARGGWTSIPRWQWFLLVLGFSSFSWWALLVIALWLIAVDWRIRASSFTAWPAWKFNAMQIGIVALTVFMLFHLVSAVESGLLGVPDMGVSGYGSRATQLNWFADQSPGPLPVGSVFSLPLWVYRLAMLSWTLWLAYILIRWLGRGLTAWLKHGYWKKIAWKREAKGETP